MERDAVHDRRLDVIRARRLAHAFEVPDELADIPVEARHRQPRGGFLERAADEVDLVLRAGVIVVDEGAAAGADADEARGFQFA